VIYLLIIHHLKNIQVVLENKIIFSRKMYVELDLSTTQIKCDIVILNPDFSE